jgi:CheY-like chemotaxis protein
LKKTPLKIYEADNGLSALKIAREILPDLIIADIRMPKMDGFQLLEKVKTDMKLKKIPVVAYSASVLKAQKERIHNSQFAGLLIKPVKVTELYLGLMNVLPYRVIKLTETGTSVPESGNEPEVFDPAGLIHSLETKFYETWKSFAVTQPIREIRNFGRDIERLGADHKSSVTIDYGKKLITASDRFDIGLLLNLLAKYTGMIETLKSATKNSSYDKPE